MRLPSLMFHRRQLPLSPAVSHELFKLELPGPYLPKQEVNRPNMRLPLQDLSNSNGLPNKAKPKRIPKVQKPIVLSHLASPANVKKREHSPEDTSDAPALKKRGVSSNASSFSDVSSAAAASQPRREP